MTPQEYEYYIGSLFSDKGYSVDVSPVETVSSPMALKLK